MLAAPGEASAVNGGMNESEADVVVVGAGAAGLAAAARLANCFDRIVVLEARERIGGRIWSERAAGWRFRTPWSESTR